MNGAPELTYIPAASGMTAHLSGRWILAHGRAVEKQATLLEKQLSASPDMPVDISGITALDTLGAWMLVRLNLGDSQIIGASAKQELLIAEIGLHPAMPPTQPRVSGLITAFEDVGRSISGAGADILAGVGFLGGVIAAMTRIMFGATRFRWTAIVNQIEHIALRGVPIVVLISFLVGAIISQQAVFQLQTFGTTAFVADLLGILILRELGTLLAAIMVAGRSGSAFTAEIGSMKMREEIDAMRTMGLDPVEVLIVPRILGLIIGLPILTFVSSIAALVGGGLVAIYYGGVSPDVFLQRLQTAIGVNTFLAGLIKAPFMALVIGLIACMEGLKVSGSAESLGRHTTASVVKSIFIVIVVDGLFAMFFAAIRF